MCQSVMKCLHETFGLERRRVDRESTLNTYTDGMAASSTQNQPMREAGSTPSSTSQQAKTLAVAAFSWWPRAGAFRRIMAATKSNSSNKTNQRSRGECPSLSARTQRTACSCHLRFALHCFLRSEQPRRPLGFFCASKLVVDLAVTSIDRCRRAADVDPGAARETFRSIIPSDPLLLPQRRKSQLLLPPPPPECDSCCAAHRSRPPNS